MAMPASFHGVVTFQTLTVLYVLAVLVADVGGRHHPGLYVLLSPAAALQTCLILSVSEVIQLGAVFHHTS